MEKPTYINELDSIVEASLNDYYNLDLIFKDYSISDYQAIINYYLNEIKYTKNKVIDFKICETILTHFDYNYKVVDMDIRKHNYSIMEEANIICDDFVKKVRNQNNRTINLPINIENVIDYAIGVYINTEDIFKVLRFITIKLSIIYNFYKDQK